MPAKLRPILCVIGLILITSAAHSEISGCNAKAIVNEMSELKQVEWNKTSSSELLEKWPQLLISKDCHSNFGNETCFYLLDIQRFVDPECECCVMIPFDSRNGNESFRQVNIYYVADNNNDVIQVLNDLLHVIGVTKALSFDEAIPRDTDFEHTWEKIISGIPTRLISSVKLQNGAWRIRFSWARPEDLKQ